MKKNLRFICWALLVSICLLTPLPLQAGPGARLSDGQTLYVPAYSHIYSGTRDTPFLLTVTLSIRNVDPQNPITITRADYHATAGKHLKKYVETPITLAPYGSTRYIIAESDKSGGSGANFIVEWKAAKPVNPPIVESVMISTRAAQGISFTSRGQVIITAK